MKLAPLQLESYFLTEATLRANQDFDPKKPTQFGETDLAVTPECHRLPEDPDRWQVTLNLKFQPAPESNPAYYFSLQVVGVVWAAPVLAEHTDRFVRTNGPSMLFGAAREMVRDLTARGPFAPLLLPSVSFALENMAAKPATPAPSSGAPA